MQTCRKACCSHILTRVWSNQVPAMRTVFGLFRLLFMMLILAHIQACVFFLMAKQNLGM